MAATISYIFIMKKFCLLALVLVASWTLSAQDADNCTAATETADAVVESLTPNEARKMRGFSSDDCVVAKGQWIFGGNASYSTHRNQDFQLAIINDIDSEGYTVNVSPMIAYAPWRNMAVGVRFGYSRSLLALDNAALDVMDVSMNIDYYHQIKHTYTGTLFWRPYIPLGHSKRFAVFAEVQLNLSGGESKVVAENGVVDGMQSYRGTYAKSFGASLALQPGIIAFITNNAAVEFSIGVFGIGLDRVKQIKNQVDTGDVISSNSNFKLNLLSIGIGASFYL